MPYDNGFHAKASIKAKQQERLLEFVDQWWIFLEERSKSWTRLDALGATRMAELLRCPGICDRCKYVRDSVRLVLSEMDRYCPVIVEIGLEWSGGKNTVDAMVNQINVAREASAKGVILFAAEALKDEHFAALRSGPFLSRIQFLCLHRGTDLRSTLAMAHRCLPEETHQLII
jgi:hypothetical protein